MLIAFSIGRWDGSRIPKELFFYMYFYCLILALRAFWMLFLLMFFFCIINGLVVRYLSFHLFSGHSSFKNTEILLEQRTVKFFSSVAVLKTCRKNWFNPVWLFSCWFAFWVQLHDFLIFYSNKEAWCLVTCFLDGCVV